MGWLWASQPSPSTSSPSKPPVDAGIPTQNAPANGAGSDPDFDPELQKFIALIQAELAGSSSSSSSTNNSSRTPSQNKSSAAQESRVDSEESTSPPSAPAQKQGSWFSFASTSKPAQTPATSTTSQTSDQESQPQHREHQQPPPDPSSPDGLSLRDSLLPTTMSCRQAFDEAFYCRSPGGQFNAVYRYGGWQSCSEQWADFWFCMRIKGMSGPVKEEAVRAHYRQREEEKYGRGKPSSEDVWEARVTRLPPGAAFSHPYHDDRVADESDAEWQVREMERREAIRRRLGFEK